MAGVRSLVHLSLLVPGLAAAAYALCRYTPYGDHLIMALPGLRGLLRDAEAPVVAVSPFVAGQVVKGPTEKFMRASGREPSAAGVADAYAGLIDGLIVDVGDPDPPPSAVPARAVDSLMDSAESRRRVAVAALELSAELR